MSTVFKRVFFTAIFSSAMLACSSVAQEKPIYLGDLKKGVAKPDIAPEIAKKMWEAEGGPFIADSIIRLDGSEKVYWLFRSMAIGQFDLTQSKNLESWELQSAEVCDQGLKCGSYWWQGRWTREELLEESVIERLTDMYGSIAFSNYSVADGYSQYLDTMGCMQHKPLRYGDINSDGKSEIIVMIAQGYSIDWLVSSEEMKKTIFAIKMNVNDVADPAKVPQRLLPDYPGANLYQYWMQTSINKGDAPAMFPAIKSYAKLYFGDFDNDRAHDILAWRKMYESRLVSDPIAGFELKSELFGHYELMNGEYKLQETEPATIESWLAAKQLTWQKGYPSKSECAGQEDQLIPEMHDPLLNDPEVLQ